MSSQIHTDGTASRTQNRIGSANYLLYMIYGMVAFTAIGSLFQNSSSQGKLWMIAFSPIVCLLGVYIQRLEIRITALESQSGNGRV